MDRIKIYINAKLQDKLNLSYSDFKDDFYEIQINNDCAVLPPFRERFGYPEYINNIDSPMLSLSQPFQCLYLFNEVKSVMFTSSLLPLNKELISSSNDQDQNNNFSSTNLSIITDFELVRDSQNSGGSFQYISNLYRYIDLNGSNDISTIDIQGYYSDFDNKLFKIKLKPGSSFSVKLMFEKL